MLACLLLGCSGSTTDGGAGGSAGAGGSSGNGGSSGSAGTGGSNAGSSGTAGSGAAPAHGPTPLCGESCTDPRGCYPCAEGSQRTTNAGEQFCVSGCWDSEPPPSVSCNLYGRQFRVGATALDVIDCNGCECLATHDVPSWGCTTKACSCAGLSGAQYVSTDPNECAVIDYACAANTEGFGGECGCGCRQNPDCAPTYDCTNGCERDLIETWCPFSEIVG